jgi:DNA-binding CsgD family transcriptional regulator
MGRETPGGDAEARGTGDLHAAMWAAWGVGLVCLLAVDPAAVDQVLGPLARLVEDRGLPVQEASRFLTDEVEALIALGRLGRAERLLTQVEAASVRPDARARVASLRCRALLCAALRDLDSADRHATDAVAHCASLEPGVEAGRTYLAAGRIARRRKQKRLARLLLEQAVVLFADPQCRPLREGAAAELARLGSAQDSPKRGRQVGRLTPTEQQVAQLSASGLRNRDVACRLGISPKTVEVNLSRVYRKLGIHSRAELGARLTSASPEEALLAAGWGNP